MPEALTCTATALPGLLLGGLLDLVFAGAGGQDLGHADILDIADDEMAQLAAAESLAAFAGADLPSLFGSTADDVKLAIGRLAARDRFASLAGEFFLPG